jgi:hypothetical protein
MRLLQRLLSIALLSVFLTSLAKADTMASLTWTDIGSLQGGSSYSVDNQDYSVLQSNAVAWFAQIGLGGAALNGVCDGDLGIECNSEFIFDETFTVTTPGMFGFGSSASMDFTTYGCFPGYCFDPVALSLSFSSTTTILGQSASYTVFGSGFNSAPFQPTANGLSPLSATAGVTGTTGSDLIYLPLGDYTFEEDFVQNVGGSGGTDGYTSVKFGFGPTPVPEPKGYLVVLLIILPILFRAKMAARTKYATTSGPPQESVNSYPS